MANGHGGARPGSGRKRKADELELNGLLSEAWPSEKRRKAFERLATVADSDRGDFLDAIKLLLAYTYGKPIDRQEISGPGGEPLQGYVTISPDDWDNTPAE